MLAASGRTRLSMRLSTELKPTVAPCSCSAFAIPQAIEWSFATPKMSAFLPSSSPIPSLLAASRPAQRPAAIVRGSPTRDSPAPAGRGPRYAPAMSLSSPAALRAALRGVRALVLDADGVLVERGAALPGVRGGAGPPRRARHPVPRRHQHLSAHRETLAARFGRMGLAVPAERIVTALSATVDHVRRTYPGGRSSS